MERTGAEGERVALVTGASRGIGRAIALRLAREGYDIAVNYLRSSEQAHELVRTLRGEGVRACATQADMADPAQAAGLIERTEAEMGPLALLVSNAGITRDRLLIQMSPADWAATWLTDLAGPRALCRAALQSMNRRGSGRIVTISSVVAATGNAGQANYAASKAALEELTRALAVEGGPASVTVNCVVPGYIPTDATADLTGQQRDVWMRRIPMRRPGTTDDIAETVAFLAGPAAAYITGQCIAVDGGLLAGAALGQA